MVLSWNLQNMLETPFPSFISKKPGEIPIFGTFFLAKIQFCPIFPWKSAFSGRPCLKTSLWCHTLADFQNFGINGKGRASPILWYHTLILWACQSQVHGDGNHPLRKMCYGKYLRKTRVNLIQNGFCWHLPHLLMLSHILSDRLKFQYISLVNTGHFGFNFRYNLFE